jgi:hypothetical protein
MSLKVRKTQTGKPRAGAPAAHSNPKGKGQSCSHDWPLFYAGNDLLSHTLSRAVPSALRGLTSVFGMGTGGPPR